MVDLLCNAHLAFLTSELELGQCDIAAITGFQILR